DSTGRFSFSKAVLDRTSLQELLDQPSDNCFTKQLVAASLIVPLLCTIPVDRRERPAPHEFAQRESPTMKMSRTHRAIEESQKLIEILRLTCMASNKVAKAAVF